LPRITPATARCSCAIGEEVAVVVVFGAFIDAA